MPINRSLIADIGMSEGNDTAFYLAKGFDVVGVEADPTLQAPLAARFGAEIAAGRLHLLHRAATVRGGESVAFFHDEAEQGHSSLLRGGHPHVVESAVQTIDWPGLRAVAGVPYYLKIDIEGAEPYFLSSMAGGGELPLFVSAELATFRPIEQLFHLGYQHFRLINQATLGRFALPDPPREGSYAPQPDLHHWSGPFGRELPGPRWFSFAEISAIYDTMHRLWEFETLLYGWLDCHAARTQALV